MTGYEFMVSSFQVLIGVICWGGIIFVIGAVVAVLIRLTVSDKKEDAGDE